MNQNKTIEINDCGICLDILNNNIKTLPCKHNFHTECIKNLTTSKCILKDKCPLCRRYFTTQEQEQEQEHIRPLTPTSSHNPTFSLPIVHAMLFCSSNIFPPTD